MTAAEMPSSKKLQIEIVELRSKLMQRDQEIVVLQEQLDWFKRQLFGQKSEKQLAIDPAVQGN